MSQIWRKFRETKGVSKTIPTGSHDSTQSSSAQASVSPKLITPAVERLFYPSLSEAVTDPLLEEPQYVTTLEAVLNNKRTRKYFLCHLMSNNLPLHTLACFWIDVHNLRLCARQLSQDARELDGRGLEESSTARDALSYISDKTCDRLDNETASVVTGTISPGGNIYKDSYRGSDNNVPAYCDSNSNERQCNLENKDASSSKVSSYSHRAPNNLTATINSPSNKNENFIFQSDASLESHQSSNKCKSLMTLAIQHSLSDNQQGNTDDETMYGDIRASPSMDELPSAARQVLIKEVWRIFEQYVAVDAEFPCTLSDNAREVVFTAVKKIHVTLDTECFNPGQLEAFNALQSELSNFLSSDLHLRHQFDMLSYTSNTLQDVLHSHAAFPSFMEYMEQTSGRPLLEFWMAADNFRNQMKHSHSFQSNCDNKQLNRVVPSSGENQNKMSSKTNFKAENGLQAQDDAMVLYDKYFSLQATHNLGFSDSFRCSIESNICREEGPHYSCFDDALRVVLYVMNTMYFPGYLKSPLYGSYIKLLINSVKNTSSGRQRTSSGSTCSSSVTDSGVMSNTLLAGSNSTMNTSGTKASLLASSPHMRIDNKHLTDPDSLWRRQPLSLRLSCGSINYLGRFESELVSEGFSTNKNDGRIARTLRRLANKEEDKARLDMAYSLAESIICEVISVTLDVNNSPSNPYHPENPYDMFLETNDASQAAGTPSLLSPTEGWSRCSTQYSSSTNLSTVSSTSHTSLHSPSKVLSYSQVHNKFASNQSQPLATPQSSRPSSSMYGDSKAALHRSSSSYQQFAGSILSGLTGTGSHGLAHSYSIASFDLTTDMEEYNKPEALLTAEQGTQ